MLLAGATGLVGCECLRLLAADPAVGEVRALVRRPLETVPGPRVRALVGSFDRLAEHPDWFRTDAIICALGTTMRDAGSRAAFRRVDFEYPLAIARLGLAQDAPHFLLVSAVGARAESPVFYNRVKGEIEDAIRELGYPRVTIVRPSLLLGDRREPRWGETLAKPFGFLMPARWAPVHARQVAAALVAAALEDGAGVRVIENAELRRTTPR
ncbi:MAG: NAD(P)H-binding protein [Gemmatimonadales bacterium]